MSARTAYTATFPVDVDGHRALVLAAVVPEDAPPVVREGLARRRLVSLTGSCPCGAVRELNRAARRAARRGAGVAVIPVEHENGCPAISPEVRRWLAMGGMP